MKSFIAAILAVLFPFLAAPANEQAKEPDTYTISIPADQVTDTYIISVPPGEPGKTPAVYTVKGEADVTEDDILANDAMQIIYGERGVAHDVFYLCLSSKSNKYVSSENLLSVRAPFPIGPS